MLLSPKVRPIDLTRLTGLLSWGSGSANGEAAVGWEGGEAGPAVGRSPGALLGLKGWRLQQAEA